MSVRKSDAAGAEGVDGGAALAQEMRRFLELGAVQLDAAIKEADGRVNGLAAAISGLATDARAIEQLAGELLSNEPERMKRARGEIGDVADRLTAHAQTAVTALQFYDKLVQRLTHVRDGLVIPAGHRGEAGHAVDWNDVLDQVRSRYSMVEERALFDFMMRGLSADSMLQALVTMKGTVTPGDLELF